MEHQWPWYALALTSAIRTVLDLLGAFLRRGGWLRVKAAVGLSVSAQVVPHHPAGCGAGIRSAEAPASSNAQEER